MGSKSDIPSIAYPDPSVPLVPAPNSSSKHTEDTTSSAQTINTDDDMTTAEGVAREASKSAVQGENATKNELSVSQIDDYLSSALYQALGHLANATPIPASSLYSGHILPSRPAAIPERQREDVVVGKSSWKKLAKWMKVVEKEGILKVKEGRGGEISVTTIHPDHPAIALHRQHKTIAKEEEQMKRTTAAADNADHPSSSKANPLVKDKSKSGELSIEVVWKPNGVNIGFWEVCGVE
jgi:translation initiation factor 2D